MIPITSVMYSRVDTAGYFSTYCLYIIIIKQLLIFLILIVVAFRGFPIKEIQTKVRRGKNPRMAHFHQILDNPTIYNNQPYITVMSVASLVIFQSPTRLEKYGSWLIWLEKYISWLENLRFCQKLESHAKILRLRGLGPGYEAAVI